MSGNDKLALKRARSAWRVMKRRCLEESFKCYPRYGGAGIRICPQWLASFDQFINDVGLPPSPKHWLGRMDTAGHYVPENVIWTDQPAQQRRRQFCRKVIVHGQVMTSAEAGRLANQPTRNSVLRRWEAGFSLERPKLAKIYKSSKWLTYQGVTLPLPEWARRLGLPSRVLWHRINRGMSIERALTPHRFRNHKPRSTNQ